MNISKTWLPLKHLLLWKNHAPLPEAANKMTPDIMKPVQISSVSVLLDNVWYLTRIAAYQHPIFCGECFALKNFFKATISYSKLCTSPLLEPVPANGLICKITFSQAMSGIRCMAKLHTLASDNPTDNANTACSEQNRKQLAQQATCFHFRCVFQSNRQTKIKTEEEDKYHYIQQQLFLARYRGWSFRRRTAASHAAQFFTPLL